MKENNSISDYLRSDRKGKEANRLEREALHDAFLYEALEGFSLSEGDPVREMAVLGKKLRYRIKRYPSIGNVWKVAALLVLGAGAFWLSRPLWQQHYQEETKLQKLAALPEKIQEKQKGFILAGDSVVTEKPAFCRKEKQEVETGMAPKPQVAPMMAAFVKDERKNAGKGPEPVGGFEKFYQYINDSLRYPQDAREQGLEGDIKLSFVVNKAGRPSHIRVVKWITYSCNHEAIRLLDEGPVWTYTHPGDTTYVVIPFRLKK